MAVIIIIIIIAIIAHSIGCICLGAYLYFNRCERRKPTGLSDTENRQQMKEILFSENECVKIINVEQYNDIKHILRNPNMIYKGPFPVYLEIAKSATRGKSIGLTYSPVDTWTNEMLRIITFEEALKK